MPAESTPSPPYPEPYALPEAANPDHLCLACGKRMPEQLDPPKVPRPEWDRGQSVEQNLALERRWRDEHRTRSGQYGRYRDNAFCTPRCAHRFALMAAHAGFRLVVPKPAPLPGPTRG